jgi:hypothetical protein
VREVVAAALAPRRAIASIGTESTARLPAVVLCAVSAVSVCGERERTQDGDSVCVFVCAEI